MSDISTQLNDSLPEIDVKAHLRKTFLLSMIMPALLLVFFWLAPSWLDYRLHEQVETSIQKSIRMTPKEKTQRLGVLKSLDFDVVATSGDPRFLLIRADLEREGIVGQFRRLRFQGTG